LSKPLKTSFQKVSEKVKYPAEQGVCLVFSGLELRDQ
jgi:hypothetical protein